MRIASGLLMLAACAAWGQAQMTVKLDDPEALTFGLTVGPHQTSETVEHPKNRVLVFVDPGELNMIGADGQKQKMTFKMGDMQWSPAGAPYKIENTTDHPIRLAIVEPKKTKNAPQPFSKMDPVAMDPAHYKIAFENAQVRALRVHYGPHEQGAMHEHILNRVVVYLNDQGKFKPGDVMMAGAHTHSEGNNTDHDTDRVAVELR